ncbi:MAG: murein L,D-transpeptidase [Myxococcales bacterium]|nr:murein L,D-transpeptidase [Myxococcales bacterium]
MKTTFMGGAVPGARRIFPFPEHASKGSDAPSDCGTREKLATRAWICEPRAMRKTTASVLTCVLAAGWAVACGDAGPGGVADGVVGNAKLAPVDGAPTLRPLESNQLAVEGGPTLGITKMTAVLRERPDPRSPQLGYLKLGAIVTRAEKPAAFDACQGGYYNVAPRGFVCLDEGATLDMEHPMLRAKLRGPDLAKPLPYAYAFVRAIAPRYYRLPKKSEQFQYEMSLDRNLRSHGRLKEKWNTIDVGANDVPLDLRGVATGPAPEEPPALTDIEKFGGVGEGTVPWFFAGGRKLPNVASFQVPDYAVITNRIKRHAGIAMIDAFPGENRDFALTTDLRLVPTSKLKPGRGSTFHGIELDQTWTAPFGFVKKDDAYGFERDKRRFKKLKQRIAFGAPVRLTGESSGDGNSRYVETRTGDWMLAGDLAIVPKRTTMPSHAKGKVKWLDISILRQTLILFEGEKPVYATMVSTGKDGLGDPKTTHSTPTGSFRIREKHVTTTMDSQMLGSEFELNEVPWVQYFHSGYAIHAAYWHTAYGRPRSHGCVNLSPIDARRIFGWTDPPLPKSWHGVSTSEATGDGTLVYISP